MLVAICVVNAATLRAFWKAQQLEKFERLKMQLYFWKDRHDGDMIQLGEKLKDGAFVCWGQMHIDGIVSIFGESVRRELDRRTLMSVSNNHTEAPVLVEARELVVDGNSVDPHHQVTAKRF